MASKAAFSLVAAADCGMNSKRLINFADKTVLQRHLWKSAQPDFARNQAGKLHTSSVVDAKITRGLPGQESLDLGAGCFFKDELRNKARVEIQH